MLYVDDLLNAYDAAARNIEIAAGQIYNVGGGRNVSAGALAGRLRELTGCGVRTAPGAPRRDFPPVCIDRARADFDFRPRSVLDDLPGLVNDYVRFAGSHS